MKINISGNVLDTPATDTVVVRLMAMAKSHKQVSRCSQQSYKSFLIHSWMETTIKSEKTRYLVEEIGGDWEARGVADTRALLSFIESKLPHGKPHRSKQTAR